MKNLPNVHPFASITDPKMLKPWQPITYIGPAWCLSFGSSGRTFLGNIYTVDVENPDDLHKALLLASKANHFPASKAYGVEFLDLLACPHSTIALSLSPLPQKMDLPRCGPKSAMAHVEATRRVVSPFKPSELGKFAY